MESYVPRTSAIYRSTHVMTHLNDTLLTGTWTYPNSKTGEINVSLWFDIILFVGILAVWVYQVALGSSTRDNTIPRDKQMENVKTFCLKGSKIESSPMTIGVEYMTKDEYSTLLAILLTGSFVFFKIIGGATGVTSGYILVAIITALFMRFTRQAGKSRVWYMFTTVLALFAMLLAFWAYTDCIPGRRKNQEYAGENMVYIFAGVLLLVAAFLKLVFTVRPQIGSYTNRGNPDTDAYEAYLTERAYAMVDGEWLYEITGMTSVVVGGSLAVFFFTEAITVALAATRWYAVPFFALYPIAIYQVAMVFVDVAKQRSFSAPIAFNLVFVLLGSFILFLLQGHACSLPGNAIGEFATGNSPYCPRIGGLKKSTDAGLKLNVTWTIILEISSALFILMAYASMVFTSLVNKSSVDAICDARGDYKGADRRVEI